MSYDMCLGSSPIPSETSSKLTFHQYTIYDSANWTQDGYICWNASLKEFYLVPFIPTPPSNEVLSESTVAVNSKKKRLTDLKRN